MQVFLLRAIYTAKQDDACLCGIRSQAGMPLRVAIYACGLVLRRCVAFTTTKTEMRRNKVGKPLQYKPLLRKYCAVNNLAMQQLHVTRLSG